jgi:ANTAR domain/GAF domain
MTDSQTTAWLTRGIADQFVEVGRGLAGAPDLRSLFLMIANQSLVLVPGAEHAGITVLRRGVFDTPTATSDLPPKVDAIQYELGTGPCVDAALDDTIYLTGDLEVDTRWPEFGKRAVVDTGVRSMLAIRLFSEEADLIAALNLYSASRHAFAEQALPICIMLATHASLALTSAGQRERIVNLEQAIKSNREVGVAVGVLMSRHTVTQQQAFDLLRMSSQRAHRKLRDVAADVVETGDLAFP